MLLQMKVSTEGKVTNNSGTAEESPENLGPTLLTLNLGVSTDWSGTEVAGRGGRLYLVSRKIKIALSLLLASFQNLQS